MRTPAIVWNSSSERWFGEPLPADPKLSRPGRARARAISSDAEFAGKDGCRTIALGNDAISAIAARSLARSYGSFE